MHAEHLSEIGVMNRLHAGQNQAMGWDKIRITGLNYAQIKKEVEYSMR